MKFEFGLGRQTKDYQLIFVAYNAKHAELRRKSKDWLLRNQDNVSEWSDMYICKHNIRTLSGKYKNCT
jgi:hypothetical protein